MEVLLFILVTYGISNIVVFGSIFEGFRDFWNDLSPNFFGKLFSCMVCLPTWVGIFISIGAHLTKFTQFSPFAHYGLDNAFLAIFLDGCLASGCVWLVHTFQEYLEGE
jgi:hypothetical protein|tara:strand:- start:3264 stop:3587 length:324 start_codon:yes stop_codon:yes gene_type:complete